MLVSECHRKALDTAPPPPLAKEQFLCIHKYLGRDEESEEKVGRRENEETKE